MIQVVESIRDGINVRHVGVDRDEVKKWLAVVQQEMERLDALTDRPEEAWAICEWIRLPFCSWDDVEERRQELGEAERRLVDAISESEQAFVCIDLRIDGESCDSLWDWIWNMGTGGIWQLKEKVGRLLVQGAVNATDLLVAIAIKNILFPIVFLILAVKCSLPIARYASRLSCGFEEGAGKPKESVVGDAEPRRQRLEQGPES